MNKLAVCFLTFMMAATTLLSCSDSKEKDADKQPDWSKPSFSEETLAKINEIYSKATIEPQTVRSVHQLAILTSICATRPNDGPISVTPARLNGQRITLVTLGGTEFVEGQATTLEESKLAAFGKPNDYLTAITRLFEDGTIPAEHPVLVTGISLGGMIAQQLLGLESILASHQISGIITFGSPLTLPLDRKEVQVVRFADQNDRVPEFGEMVLRSGMATKGQITKEELAQKLQTLDQTERLMRKSKYTDMLEVHALSYIEDACWDEFDFWGNSSGKNVLELLETMKFYAAPKLPK